MVVYRKTRQDIGCSEGKRERGREGGTGGRISAPEWSLSGEAQSELSGVMPWLISSQLDSDNFDRPRRRRARSKRRTDSATLVLTDGHDPSGKVLTARYVQPRDGPLSRIWEGIVCVAQSLSGNKAADKSQNVKFVLGLLCFNLLTT